MDAQALPHNAPAAPDILPATWHDFGAIRKLEKICFPVDAWPFWDMLGVLALPNVIRLKALAGGSMVGFIAVDVRRWQNLAWIATICVLPAYRRSGIATNLIEACIAELGVARLRLSVRASNEAAKQLYLKLGFSEVERWKRYYQGGEAAIVMEKKLS